MSNEQDGGNRPRRPRRGETRPLEPAGDFVSRAHQRAYFLSEVRRLQPAVLGDLREKVYPLFRQAAPQLYDPIQGSGVRSWPALATAMSPSPLRPLRDALIDWAARYGLEKSDNDWVIRCALATMDRWYQIPQDTPEAEAVWHADRERLRAEYRAETGQDPEDNLPALQGVITPCGHVVDRSWNWDDAWLLLADPIGADDRRLAPFEHAGWDPFQASRAEARQAILDAFAGHLDRYLDAMDARLAPLLADGSVAPAPSVPSNEHFTWLVCYQVLGEDYAAIAKHEYRDARTVADAARTIAALIKMTPRPPRKGGRPPGAKDVRPRQSRR